MRRAEERLEALRAARPAARDCTRCPQLARTRTQVVFGTGNPDAELVVVVDAPGREEDLLGVPLAGRPYELLAELLAAAGLDPADVYVTGALLCRPPDNRDPSPSELDRCREHLLTQLELVRPRVVCTAGTVATRALRGRSEPIVRARGRDEIVTAGGLAVRVLPVLHPAAALYQRGAAEQLAEDLARLPGLLALPRPAQPGDVAEPMVVEPVPAVATVVPVTTAPPPAAESGAEPQPPAPDVADTQLELF